MNVLQNAALFITGIIAGLFGISSGENLGGGPGTINQLEQWKATTTPYSAITTNVSGKNIYTPESEYTIESLTIASTSATSTFAGNVHVDGNLQVDGKLFAPVTIVSAGEVTGTHFTATDSAATSTFAGRVGIGVTPTSAYPLSFAASNGAKINLYNGLNFGIGMGANLLQMFVPSGSSRISLGLGSSASFTEVLTVSTNVGVGTTSPYARFAVINTGSIPSFIVEDSTSPDTTPFIIDESGNVGIGTPSPAVPLEVRRTNDSGTIFRIGTVGSAGYFDFNRSAATGALHIQGNQSGFQNIVLAPTAGNVGIGSTSPSKKLSIDVGSNDGLLVRNTSLAGSSFELGFPTNASGEPTISACVASTGSTCRIFQRQSTTNDVFVGDIDDNNGAIRLRAGGSTAMSIIDGGNVGIATTTPATTLSVSGNGYLTGGLGVGTVNTTAGSIQTTGDLTVGVQGGGNRTITINSSNGSGKRAFLSHDGSGLTIGYSIANQYLNLGSSSSGWVNGIFYYGGKHIFDGGGNVGIGTTTPYAKLSVTNTGSGPSFVVEDTSSPDSSPFIIDSSGNVGIGEASPGEKLSVVGTDIVTLNVESNNITSTAFAVNNTAQNQQFEFGVTGTSNSYGNGSFLIWNRTGSQGPLLITSTGNTRIGHVNNSGTVGSKLSVVGNLSIGSTYYATAAPTDGVIVEGNVGIGTTTAPEKLTVNGNIKIVGSNGGFRFGTGGNDVTIFNFDAPDVTNQAAIIRFFRNTTTSGSRTVTYYKDGSGTAGIHFDLNGNNSYFNTGGNIGIGTTSPYAKLSVVGETVASYFTATSTDQVSSFGGLAKGGLNSLTDAATIDIDWKKGNTAYVVLGDNRTITFSNIQTASALRLFVVQDGTGSRTLTWPAYMRWQGGAAPTLTTTANKVDIVSLITATSTTSVFGAASLNY